MPDDLEHGAHTSIYQVTGPRGLKAPPARRGGPSVCGPDRPGPRVATTAPAAAPVVPRAGLDAGSAGCCISRRRSSAGCCCRSCCSSSAPQIERGKVPASAKAALTSGGNMLTSTNTVLILGTDQRPKGSKEPGANTSDAGSRSDTIMLWRIGGGTSRRLSIPRDTVVHDPRPRRRARSTRPTPTAARRWRSRRSRSSPGHPKINHLIIVNLAALPDFIDAIGGVDVKTGRVCSEISGGVKNGGFTLQPPPGTHHLNGTQALRLRAHAREPLQPGRERPDPRPAPAADPQRDQVAADLARHVLPAAVGVLGRAARCCATDMGGPTLLACSRPRSSAARRRSRC